MAVVVQVAGDVLLRPPAERQVRSQSFEGRGQDVLVTPQRLRRTPHSGHCLVGSTENVEVPFGGGTFIKTDGSDRVIFWP